MAQMKSKSGRELVKLIVQYRKDLFCDLGHSSVEKSQLWLGIGLLVVVNN
jgi:hypothetical protein